LCHGYKLPDMKRCNCHQPPPPPKPGPVEYVPSALYPDVGMPPPPPVPVFPPGPMPPFPPEPMDPCNQCPPKVYRNPPNVIVRGGTHVCVEPSAHIGHMTYTVSSTQWPVTVDPENDGILYGDGTPESPLGIYDFEGATDREDGKPGTVPAPRVSEREMFLCGDGTWKPMGGTRECTVEEMDAWIGEVNDGQ